MPKNSVSQAGLRKTERGEGERRGGGVLKSHCLPRGGTLKFCWLEFAKNLEKFLRNLNGPFLTFLPTFFEFAIKAEQKSFRGKPTFFTALRVSKMAFDFAYSLRLTDMYIMT